MMNTLDLTSGPELETGDLGCPTSWPADSLFELLSGPADPLRSEGTVR